MRKILLLMLIVAVAMVAIYRQRLFLRDPLGSVYADDSKVEGARVFINYSNDVLVMRDDAPAMMVQGWDRTPGTPRQMTCFRTMACLTGRDEAEKIAAGGAAYDPKTTMTNRQVTYMDPGGRRMRVVIR